MSTFMTVALDKNIRKNPKKIAELITQTANEINACKNNLQEIKNRGFFKKLFSDNIGDLANAMIQQNDTISLFMYIVQSLIVFNMFNTTQLGEIRKQLNMHEQSKGSFQNEYVDMASDFISEFTNSAMIFKDKIDANEELIKQITDKIIENAKLHEKQDELFENIKARFSKKDKVDKEQYDLIKVLNRKIESKENIDEEQWELIKKLEKDLNDKNKIDANQTKLLKLLEDKLIAKDSIDKKQSESIERLFSCLKEKDNLDNEQSKNILDLFNIVSNLEKENNYLKNKYSTDNVYFYDLLNKLNKKIKLSYWIFGSISIIYLILVIAFILKQYGFIKL